MHHMNLVLINRYWLTDCPDMSKHWALPIWKSPMRKVVSVYLTHSLFLSFFVLFFFPSSRPQSSSPRSRNGLRFSIEAVSRSRWPLISSRRDCRLYIKWQQPPALSALYCPVIFTCRQSMVSWEQHLPYYLTHSHSHYITSPQIHRINCSPEPASPLSRFPPFSQSLGW